VFFNVLILTRDLMAFDPTRPESWSAMLFLKMLVICQRGRSLVGAGEQLGRNGEAKCLCSGQYDIGRECN
jgi:hypothetical protein